MHKHPFALNRRQFMRLGVGTALLLPAHLALGQSATVDARTRFGTVRGRRFGTVNVFKGIPYGASTAGPNRFMPPRDPAPWREYREAFEYGPAAPQSNPASGRQQDGNESEDCLVLNVWTRGINDGGKRPVMFWCHGGGFTTLSGSSPRYDGSNLALRGDVVVVTINHRLNMLGFTHFGDLGDRNFATSGTVGMQDIVHALKWVRDNIENFGGDPNRVMIFGESGGGRKVNVLLGMPSAKGLFHAAMIESGATLRLPEREPATGLAQRVLAKLNLDGRDLSAIQQVPLDQLMAVYFAVSEESGIQSGGGTFAPTMDGDVMPYHPFYPTASPVNPSVPVIVGANRTEMTYFAADEDFSIDEATMRERAAAYVGAGNVDAVVGVYRAANPGASAAEIYFLIFSDHNYVMPSITIAERRSALQGGPVYLYYLAWRSPANDGRIMSPHTLDIPFVFDNELDNPLTRDSATASLLADRISDTIINFARTGDPNTGKLPQWRPYDSAGRATMVWNDDSQVIDDPLKSRREIMQPILKL